MRCVHYSPADSLNLMEAALLQRIADFYQNTALTEQINHCQVLTREYSGCGFFTTLVVPDDSPYITVGASGHFGGSDLDAPGLSHGAGSLLFVREGRLHFLEVFTYVDGDPAQASTFELKPIAPAV